MALCDPQSHTFVQINPSLCAFLARSQTELMASSWQSLIHPDDRNVDTAMAQELLLGRQESYRICKRFLRPDGAVVWGDLSVVAIRQNDGRLRLLLKQIIDITEMVQVQAQLKEQQLQLRSTLDSLLDPHLLLDVVRDGLGLVHDFLLADANEKALHVLRSTKEKLLGRSLLSILPGINHSPLMTLLMDAADRGGSLVLDDIADPTGLLAATGGYVEVRAIRVNGVLSLTWRDVTDRHQMIQRIATSEQKHRLLTENASDVVMLLRQGLIEWISPALSRMLGWSPANWIGHPFEQFVHPDDLGLAKKSCQDEHHGGSRVTRLRLRDHKGKHHWVEAHTSAVFSNEGIQDAIVASFRTVDQEVAIEQELERRARFDDLTGLANRSEMLERFRILLSSRHRRVPLGILFIDIDEFKLINDTYGHVAGDTVLKSMAQRIHQVIRKRDWAARIGGDEMLVALPGLNSLDKAMMIAEKIRIAAHRPLDFAEHKIRFSISVGVTLASSAESVDAILARADRAMYQAKQRGRDLVMAISPD
jgi:diguanylate cyclase (GGDEF)-like protein/PAS domain S-box-containing protein